ncbi:MAG: hypothetical protein V1723_01035 [Candidatus Uhrbacteria bacterium]
MSEKYTPEEIAKLTESRTAHDAKLIEGGAHYVPAETGEPILAPTAEQIEVFKNTSTEAKEKQEITELLQTFSTPDQIGELDFREFLRRPLFGSYYRSDLNREDPFEDVVCNTSKPFNGLKGRMFQEIIVKERVGEQVVRSERDIQPISLNEWRYLLSQLTEEQLLGNTYYFVRFDDGVVRSIEVSLSKSGGGPYEYGLRMRGLSSQDSFDGNVNPRIIAPAE